MERNEIIIRKNKTFNFFLKNIYILFIFTLVFFNHTILSQLAMMLFVLNVILLCLLKKKFYFSFYFFLILLFILQSYISSSIGISINSQTSNRMTLTMMLNLIVSISLYNYILIYDNLYKSLLIFAKIILLFTFMIIIISIGNITNIRLGTDISFSILGSVVEYNANIIALLSGVSYIIFLYEYIKIKKNSILLLMIWLILIILLSGSRKGFFSIVIGTTLMLYMLNPNKIFKNIFILSIGILVLYLIVMKIPLFYSIIGNRVESYIQIVLGSDIKESSTNTRALYIIRGWSYFLDKPWTGYGLDCFRYLSGSFGTYSHNNYIELLVSGGIPSLFLFYFFRIVVIIKLFVDSHKDKSIVTLLFVIATIITVLEYGFVDYYERIFEIIFIFNLCGYSRIKKIRNDTL